MTPPPKGANGGWLLLAFAGVAVVSSALALGQIDEPGLYYDEAIQAVPAAAFLADRPPAPIPGRSETRLFGGWFPVMTQPYMGALKSQLLIAPFALFGPGVATLRVSTWLWTLIGVGFAMLLARELWDTPTALVCGALLAVDPSVLFVGRHDWGSFALAFLLRSAGLWLALAGWRRRSGLRLFLAGLAFGLGLYNKVDFGVFLAAAGLGWALAAPGTLVAAAHSPRRLGAAAAGFVLGAAPMLAALPGALAAGEAFASGPGLAWGEKWVALFATLDGSYFQRLIAVGGRFDALADLEGSARSPFPLFLAGAWLFLAARVFLGDPQRRRERALLVAWVALGLAGYALTPNAVRIHHVLAIVPFAQLCVAAAAVEMWRARRGRAALRSAAVCGVALLLVSAVRVDLHTLTTLDETGGRGRWSDALGRFASGLEPGTRVVALDWGFAEPLRLMAPQLRVIEPVWQMRRGAPVQLEGDGSQVYLVPGREWAVFGHGDPFLEALGSLPPESAEIAPQRDRTGRPAFLAVRIARPHRLDYRGGGVHGEAAMSVIEVLGLDHVVLRVADLERSLGFYRDALGCRVERTIEKLGLYQLRAGDALIDLVPVDGVLGRAGGPAPGETGRNVDHVALRIASFDEEKLRGHLEAHGIEPAEVAERYGATGTGPSMYVRDPDGNVVELKGPGGA